MDMSDGLQHASRAATGGVTHSIGDKVVIRFKGDETPGEIVGLEGTRVRDAWSILLIRTKDGEEIRTGSIHVHLQGLMSTVRSQICEGCWRRCKYADFKPLADWSFQDARTSLMRQVRDGVRTGSRAHIARHTILGKLHEMKQRMWNRQTATCPHQGERLPKTIGDFLTWAGTLHAVTVRVTLGMDQTKAHKLHTALKVSELAAIWKRLNEVPF